MTDDTVSNSVDSTTDTTNDVINDEERLRQEAAKRLERRRRKMMNPEERLARITGRPVSSVSPSSETSPPSFISGITCLYPPDDEIDSFIIYMNVFQVIVGIN